MEKKAFQPSDGLNPSFLDYPSLLSDKCPLCGLLGVALLRIVPFYLILSKEGQGNDTTL